MIELVGVDGLDLVDVQVELGRLPRDARRDGLEFGVAAPDDGAGAGALGRAVVLAETPFVVASLNEK